MPRIFRSRRQEFTLSRDLVLFSAGLLGVIHETIIAEVERPFLLALFAAMIGLTGFLKAEEARKENGKRHPEEDRTG